MMEHTQSLYLYNYYISQNHGPDTQAHIQMDPNQIMHTDITYKYTHTLYIAFIYI